MARFCHQERCGIRIWIDLGRHFGSSWVLNIKLEKSQVINLLSKFEGTMSYYILINTWSTLSFVVDN